ncbi:neutral/alkaline non-lysosomal ceramidase N-terminal domain-containing protein [bacterium]|nr:neutral/alkaline non-lysosomal ceramidase N-terminal domain-containing protein [bacterium]
MNRVLPLVLVALTTAIPRCLADEYRIGSSKIDMTPPVPVRLSGYSNRTTQFEGVDEPLFARTLAIKDQAGQWTVWASVEILGVSPSMRDRILKEVEPLEVSSARFALCATHTHTAPQLKDVAKNILAPRLAGAEADRRDEYTQRVCDCVVKSIKEAIRSSRPARLELGWTEAHFAANRRVLDNGKCVAMAPYPAGATDTKVPVLRATGVDGKVIGILFSYACHATTLGGDYNRVSGDWPGLAAGGIEKEIAGAVALPLIGCGADTNPEPRGRKEMAIANGLALTKSVLEALAQPMKPIRGGISAVYGLVGLPIDRPNQVQLAARLLSDNPHIKQNAEDTLAILEHKDRIPETYPAPIQVIRWGDDLTMIFMGGEVVGDYAFRIRKEFADQIPSDKLWVTAYANDVYGYLASERMIDEGGYEYDYSMVFYDQPGPWSRGTEEAVIARVHDLIENPDREGNLSPTDSLRSIHVAEGLEVEQVACEPLTMDPVNIAFDAHGRFWVAEMSDYPLGADGKGSPGGRIRCLEDTNGDGVFDKSTLVLEGLQYTTGVEPYRDGVLVSSAPEVFAITLDPKTGKVISKKTILDGFGNGNPQHVVNGFAVGIDNWIYVNGDETGDIRSLATGKIVPMSGRDGRFKPDTGELETECGMTQHLRSRDDFGQWFGGANYCPFWHYVLEEKYVARNPFVPSPRPWHDLYGGYYPAVFPSSRITGKFNDLFTANRFTSACSPMPYRDQLLGEGSSETVLVCEPVHNLVHRARRVPEGLSFRAERFPADQSSEFFSSSDPWCRPVRVITGPDGAVWIADMYRQVIEHPTWIPEAWLERLDVRAGHDKGRIYRIYPKGKRPSGAAIPNLAQRQSSELVSLLRDPNGWKRDTAQRLLIERNDASVVGDLEKLVSADNPRGAIHALGTLHGMGKLRSEVMEQAIDHREAEVRRWGIRFADERIAADEDICQSVVERGTDTDRRVRYQAALTLGYATSPEVPQAIARVALADLDDPWVRTAVLSSSTHQPREVLAAVLSAGADEDKRGDLVDGLLATSIGKFGNEAIEQLLIAILPEEKQSPEPWQWSALSTLIDSLDRKGLSLARWDEKSRKQAGPARGRLRAVLDRARELAQEKDADTSSRVAAVGVLARGPERVDDDKTLLASLLTAISPGEVQSAAVTTLGKCRSDDIPDRLLSDWRSHSPMLRSQIISLLLARPGWARQIVEGIEKGNIGAMDIEAPATAELVHHNNQDIAERAKKLFEASQSTRQEVLDRYVSVLTMAGDASAGRSIFEKHCGTCHRFGSRGQLVGPYLGGVRDRSPGYLLGAVLDPNRAVESKYVSYSVELSDGRVLSGMLVVESSSSITLARADGTKVEVLRTEIERMVSSGRSFMPEGLEKDLDPQQLADLFSFLAQPPESVGP